VCVCLKVRLNRDGTRAYHSNTHSGTSVAAMHDHADMPRTCGMGEFEAVLNGVHFRLACTFVLSMKIAVSPNKHCSKILQETLLNSVSNDFFPFMVRQSHDIFTMLSVKDVVFQLC
jgi:hypothetical protein